ncbi:MAG TPA: endonuclease V, partial [Betaproteobacteria bacterium]|nr:endonuclease V [Betaproteobacteria bacterium]
MNIAPCPHSWRLTPAEARDIQQSQRSRVALEDRLGPVRRVAGVDVGFEDDNRVARAAVAVLSFPALTLEEVAIGRAPVTFPYIPGLLSFREMPAVLDALRRLRLTPDLLLC